MRRIPPRLLPSRTIASRCSGFSSPGSMTVAPFTPPPSTIVFVPGPVISEELGARINVYVSVIAHSLSEMPARIGFFREIHSRLPFVLPEDGIVRWHVACHSSVEGLAHATERGQVAQLVKGGKRERHFTTLRTCQHIGRLKPHPLARLQPIVERLLLGWGRRQEEMRIEALGQLLRRDPVRKVAKVIGS